MPNYHIKDGKSRAFLHEENMFYRRADMSSSAPAPAATKFVFDAPASQRTGEEKLLLERHFNDLYAVFLHKLAAFALQARPSKDEIGRLRRFFDELLRVRELLGK